jgi:hypothetical protein
MIWCMIRSNHYEVAFEAYLRHSGIGYLAVDEAKRTLLGDTDVKSLDFVVVGPKTAKLVVDVKGRKFPTGTATSSWQNWTEEEDISGLQRWAGTFGPDYRGVLAFLYQIQAPYVLPKGTPDYFCFKNERYLLRGIDVAEYQQHMRPRSTKWRTVHLPMPEFRRMVKPFSQFLKIDAN